VRRWFPILVAASLLAAAPPASAKDTGRCAAKGSETVRASDRVRVYWKDEVLYGCVRSSGLTRTLYEDRFIPNDYFRVHLVRIAAFRVAFVVTDVCTVCGDPGPFSSIYSVALRSGKRRVLHHVRGRPEGSNLGTRVDALVLDRCGRVAYRAVLDSVYAHDETDPDPELHTWVGSERRRVDRGAIVRSSIRLTPGSVEWVRDGEERSAPLTPTC
jgi:hypothetical protein